MLVFLLLGYAPHLVQAYEERENIKHFMLIRQNVVFDPGQVEWLFQHTGPDDIIVYNDDFLRHYFLSHGGSRGGPCIYPSCRCRTASILKRKR